MAIQEKPLFGTVDIQKRNVLKFPDTDVYRHAFTTQGDWAVSHTATIVPDEEHARSSTGYALRVARVGTKEPLTLSRTFDSLVVGATYTLTARVRTQRVLTWFRLWIDGMIEPPRTEAYNQGWREITREFIATATSHAITIEGQPGLGQPGDVPGDAAILADTVTLTRHAWEEPQSPEWLTYISDATNVSITRGASVKGLVQETDIGIMSFTLLDSEDPMNGGTLVPGDDVRAVAVVGTITRPIFTGTLWDVEARYELDKNTGQYRNYNRFTATDAVAVHEKTQRNGVRGTTEENPLLGAFTETFEDRIERLTETSTVPVNIDPGTWNPDDRRRVWST